MATPGAAGSVIAARLSRSYPRIREFAPNLRMADHRFIIDLMLSWDSLDPSRFKPAGVVTTAFLHMARTDLRTAGQYVCGLPYGRNSDPNDPLIVLAEQRGTCSTKHALLRRLAIEQGLDVALVVGIYEMTERNTPGVGQFCSGTPQWSRRGPLLSSNRRQAYRRNGGVRSRSR